MSSQEKLVMLTSYLKSLGSVAIAFSGGVDSTFLLKVAKEALGDRVLAITAYAGFIPPKELIEATEFCKEIGVEHLVCDFSKQEIPGFRENPPDRCYLCKTFIFTKVKELAASKGIEYVAEGSNMDDLGDYRPGLKALAELDVKSPLREAQLYKNEIRELSKEYGLATWSKPSLACLASRFPYGQEITAAGLKMVGEAEAYLFSLGFKQLRVRIHGKMARLEMLPSDIIKVVEQRENIDRKLKTLGFSYVALDLQGYRTGSMNETLNKK